MHTAAVEGFSLLTAAAAAAGACVAVLQADWDYFGHQFQAPFSRWPLMVATGVARLQCNCQLSNVL
jgi:hypothetical protein